MALRNKSLFLYGFEVTSENRYIEFGAVIGEIPGSGSRTAILNLGFYSLSSLGLEIERAMAAADPQRIYSVTSDRTYSAGLENRVTIATNGTFLSIYFLTGNPSNLASIIGFNTADYTGATSYLGATTTGTSLIPFYNAYTYLSPEMMKKNFGALNVAASGLKESITFSLQHFWQAQFRFIPEADIPTLWSPLVDWMIQQRELEFTPDITAGNTYFSGTLEGPNEGLDMTLTEQIPQFPFNYQTPLMKFRQRSI